MIYDTSDFSVTLESPALLLNPVYAKNNELENQDIFIHHVQRLTNCALAADQTFSYATTRIIAT
jgi:hypothetical protein